MFLYFYGVQAPTTGYTRVCYIGVKKHRVIFSETVFLLLFSVAFFKSLYRSFEQYISFRCDCPNSDGD